MTLRVVLRPRAHHDLVGRAEYLARSSRAVARRFLSAMNHALDRLTQMPLIGGVWDDENEAIRDVRCWSLPDFENDLIFYRVTTDTIEVVRILHGAQDIAKILALE